MAWNPQTEPHRETAARFEVEPATSGTTGRRRKPTWVIIVAVLALVGLMAGGAVALALWGLGLFRSSDVYVGAMEQLRENPAAIAILGEPIEDGWLPQGSLNISGPSGNADLAIEVSGPKAAGTLYIVATMKAGMWTYETLTLSVDGKRTDLLKSD